MEEQFNKKLKKIKENYTRDKSPCSWSSALHEICASRGLRYIQSSTTPSQAPLSLTLSETRRKRSISRSKLLIGEHGKVCLGKNNNLDRKTKLFQITDLIACHEPLRSVFSAKKKTPQGHGGARLVTGEKVLFGKLCATAY